MRRATGTILTISAILLTLIGLSAARYLTFDRPPESETASNRSTYNSGPTGIRAFYQTLEESGWTVSRWRKNHVELGKRPGHDLLIVVGPLQTSETGESTTSLQTAEEVVALQQWVGRGGRVLLISRSPDLNFKGPVLRMKGPVEKETNPQTEPLANPVDPRSDRFIAQPTRLTRGIEGLALSTFAARLQLSPAQRHEEDSAPPTAKASSEDRKPASEKPSAEKEGIVVEPHLYAPVVHLEDGDGAILVDFKYGDGQVVILADPFVIANNGIARGANLDLALNLIRDLTDDVSGQRRQILFDEYHHGFRDDSSSFFAYFRGTPWPMITLQVLILGLLILYSKSRRFSRPLPLSPPNRQSALEFVGSMASLQKRAAARDLAIENIYPRFRQRIRRQLGFSNMSGQIENEALISRLAGLDLSLPVETIRHAVVESQQVLDGKMIDDQQLLAIVRVLRQIQTEMNRAHQGRRRY
jgi:hypothetical protein